MESNNALFQSGAFDTARREAEAATRDPVIRTPELGDGAPPMVFADVGAWHRKMGLPVTGDQLPHLLDPVTFEYRVTFLREELQEFIDAHNNGDIYEAADALGDLLWVVAGTAHYMHIPLDSVWLEIRRANNEKVRRQVPDPNHKRGAAEVIAKPEGWVPPHHRAVFEKFVDRLMRLRRKIL